MPPASVLLDRSSLPSATLALAFLITVAPVRAEALEGSPAPSIDVPHPVRSVTLGEALAYAHAHQPSVRAALARASARMAEAKIPSGRWLPTVGVTAQIFGMTANNTTASYVSPGTPDLPRIGATLATSTGSLSPSPSTLVAAGLEQEVYDFGRISAQRSAADALAVSEGQRADAERLDVDFGVEEAFFAVLAAKAVVSASEQAYQRSRVHRDLAKRGVDSGLRSPIDLTRAEADLTRFDIGRVRAQGGVAIAQSVLAAAIGAPDPALDVADEAPRPAEMPALGEALALAEHRDPRLGAALAELRAAEQRTRAIAAELRPDLSATATFSGRAGGASPSSGPVPSGDGWLPAVPNWDVGLILSWSLFDGTVAARRDAALTQEQVRRDEIDVAREQEVAAVRRTYVEVQVARSALVAFENAVTAARANYDQADARFRAGVGTAVELADAEAVRADAEISLAMGQFDVARARAAFGRAIAEGL
jgi:outer membrane protein